MLVWVDRSVGVKGSDVKSYKKGNQNCQGRVWSSTKNINSQSVAGGDISYLRLVGPRKMCILLIRISSLIYVTDQGQIVQQILSYWSVTMCHLRVRPSPAEDSGQTTYKEFGVFIEPTYLFFTVIPVTSLPRQRQLLRIQISYLSITMKTTVDTNPRTNVHLINWFNTTWTQ